MGASADSLGRAIPQLTAKQASRHSSEDLICGLGAASTGLRSPSPRGGSSASLLGLDL